ncbi:ANK1, partial [Symbiodinium sp. KB8]
KWMRLVLTHWDAMATNVANTYRLQEECDVCSLVLAKYKGTINLYEFKAVMLSSLRSVLPAEWDMDHEVAWNWLWDNVERMLK